MACSTDFIDFACKQIEGAGVIRTRKMFGDYCIYVDEKPIILACDNIVYIKKHKAIVELMQDAECGFPYDGAKEHYILDIEHSENAVPVIKALLPHIPLPKPKKKKNKLEVSSSAFSTNIFSKIAGFQLQINVYNYKNQYDKTRHQRSW